MYYIIFHVSILSSTIINTLNTDFQATRTTVFLVWLVFDWNWVGAVAYNRDSTVYVQQAILQ